MKKTFGIVTASAVHTNENSKTTDSLEVRQECTTVYPSARGANSMSDALFSDTAFGDGQEFTSERVAFIKIPKGTTLAKAKQSFQKIANGGHIYRVMSHDITDVATEEQMAMMNIEDLREKLVAIDPTTGDQVLYNGKPFYRATFWKKEFTKDIDRRPETSNAVQSKQAVSETEDLPM